MIGRIKKFLAKPDEAAARKAILSAVAHGERSSAQIAKRTNISTAWLHLVLLGMEADKILSSRWDDDMVAPRQRLYRAVKPTCGPWG